MEYVVGSRDGKRRNVYRRTTTTVRDTAGEEHVIAASVDPNNPSLPLRSDHVVCDVELEPGRWFVQVVRKKRIFKD